MTRGTTPLLRFVLPFNADLLDTTYITMIQDGETLIEKTLEDCEKTENVLSVRLTQEETLKLESGRAMEIQVRARLKSEEAVASQIVMVPVDRILKDGVI